MGNSGMKHLGGLLLTTVLFLLALPLVMWTYGNISGQWWLAETVSRVSLVVMLLVAFALRGVEMQSSAQIHAGKFPSDRKSSATSPKSSFDQTIPETASSARHISLLWWVRS